MHICIYRCKFYVYIYIYIHSSDEGIHIYMYDEGYMYSFIAAVFYDLPVLEGHVPESFTL